MRRESARELGRIALAEGRDAADPAAQALLRAQQLIAEQPAMLVAALERASDGSGVVEATDAVVRFLRETDPHGAMDQRLARALRRRFADEAPGRSREAVVARVVATGKVSLARAIVDGTADVSAGLAHLGDDAPPPPPEKRRRWFR
jgi:hypothetical protein